MKRASLVAVALILALGFIACQDEFGIRNAGESKTLEPDGAGSSPYFPYEVGRKWNYEGHYTMTEDYPEGWEGDTTLITNAISSTEVIRETQLTGPNPLPVWELKTTYASEYYDTTYYLYERIEGDSAYVYEHIDDSEPWHVYPSEPQLGDTWETYMVDGAGDTIITSYEVIADNAEVNGYANCLMIQVTPDWVYPYDEYEQFSYWAKGEGEVLNTLYMLMIIDMGEDGEIVITTEGETKLIKGPGIEE
jgi:hypothetical protein